MSIYAKEISDVTRISIYDGTGHPLGWVVENPENGEHLLLPCTHRYLSYAETKEASQLLRDLNATEHGSSARSAIYDALLAAAPQED